MIRYSLQPKSGIFVSGYRFLSFVIKIGKSVIGEHSEKRLHRAKNSATDAVKTVSKKDLEKEQKQVVIWFLIKSEIKFEKIQRRII